MAHSRKKVKKPIGPNALNSEHTSSLQIKKSLQLLSVTVNRTLRITHVLRQRVNPDSRASNRKCPTSVGRLLSRYHDCWQNADVGAFVVTSTRNWRAVVDQVPKSLVVLASVYNHTELVFATSRNVQPMKIGMHESRQTTVKFPGITDNAFGVLQCSTLVANASCLSVMVFNATAKTALQ